MQSIVAAIEIIIPDGIIIHNVIQRFAILAGFASIAINAQMLTLLNGTKTTSWKNVYLARATGILCAMTLCNNCASSFFHAVGNLIMWIGGRETSTYIGGLQICKIGVAASFF